MLEEVQSCPGLLQEHGSNGVEAPTLPVTPVLYPAGGDLFLRGGHIRDSLHSGGMYQGHSSLVSTPVPAAHTWNVALGPRQWASPASGCAVTPHMTAPCPAGSW